MKLKIIAVGKRMPDWVDAAVADFCRRFSKGLNLQVQEVATASRSRSDDASVYATVEGRAILSRIRDPDWVVALEIGGTAMSTRQLARWLDKRISAARNVVFVIGGPDGLSGEVLQRADEQWSLSTLTLPHGLARVVVAEALYRANSLRLGHPYHRA
ncbi:MAG: 23S rRNA (pseudouridine(1915)-N(3))-methyltransferase RlmH [Gammaproteobacteria bacterium]|nr:23S rRNA (pseudouridine(1915)-N(3))-methyltransferase RlmH [Gammaproteobacteria bacterium]